MQYVRKQSNFTLSLPPQLKGLRYDLTVVCVHFVGTKSGVSACMQMSGKVQKCADQRGWFHHRAALGS